MKRFSLLALTLLTACAFSASIAIPASAALPELLPTSNGTRWVGSGGAATLETLKSESVASKEVSLDGEQLTDTLGVYHIHFKGTGVASLNVKCNTAGDETGVVLVLGEYHFVSDVAAPSVAILLLVNEFSFECTALAKFKVKGHILCLALSPLTLSMTHEFHCKAVSSGMPESNKWTNDSGGTETAVLLVSKNGGAFEEGALVWLFIMVFAEAVAFESPF